MGYGLKTESIPDICHFGKNIILLKKLYYNNILSVKNKKMHAIEYFTNVKVSDNFVDVILQIIAVEVFKTILQYFKSLLSVSFNEFNIVIIDDVRIKGIFTIDFKKLKCSSDC
jgi:hypothetical protein